MGKIASLNLNENLKARDERFLKKQMTETKVPLTTVTISDTDNFASGYNPCRLVHGSFSRIFPKL